MRQLSIYIALGFIYTAVGLALVSDAGAQSRDQNFPTPVTSSEIAGIIPARDMGDARLTTYYYAFEGTQGDIFINVVTRNLSGDIDIFLADTMQPLTKIVMYADSSQNETGRLIYLRRPARLMLRVQGRTPNDDPASFGIRLGGSFVALQARDEDEEPTLERIDRNTAGVRVNSVGTIIEVLPRDVPAKETAAKSEAEERTETRDELARDERPAAGSERPSARKPAPEVKTIFGSKAAEPETAATRREAVRSTSGSEPAGSTRAGRRTAEPPASVPAAKVAKADPFASIYLRVLMKDGGRIERPMSEVSRFSVDRGVLLIVGKDGKTERFSLLNVEQVTIQ